MSERVGSQSREIPITEALPDDAEGIREVTRLGWLATYPSEEYGITREDIEAVFARGDNPAGAIRRRRLIAEDESTRYWVAKDEGKVVGFIIGRKAEDRNSMGALYVLPEYQGRGLGSRLMETGLAWLGGQKQVAFGVAVYNRRAIQFFERLGFVQTGRPFHSPWTTLPSGKAIPEIEVVKMPDP